MKNLYKIFRKISGCEGKSYPIVAVEGDSPPQLRGERYCYKNKRGDIIRNVNAYQKYGRVIYHPSTMRIEVGKEWPMHMGLLTCKLK